MRANDLVLKIKEPVIRSLVREGYKVYDANGALLRTCEDEVIDQAAWNETIRSFADGTLYALKQDGENYVFEIDAPDEEEYVLAVSGTQYGILGPLSEQVAVPGRKGVREENRRR